MPRRSPRTGRFFLDIDGTLLDFARRPDARPRRRRAAAHCSSACARRPAAPSRSSAAARSRTSTGCSRRLRCPSAGQHGVERRDADGRTAPRTPRRAAPRAAAAAELAAARRATPGPGARGQGPDARAALPPGARARARCVAARDARASRRAGRRLRAADAASASSRSSPPAATRARRSPSSWREPPFAAALPVFVGDDLTDEFGFDDRSTASAATRSRSAPGPTRARWRLRDVAAVRRWLGARCARRRPRRGRPDRRDEQPRPRRSSATAAIGALVDRRGEIVWACFPRFDGDPLFCSLLRERRGRRRFRLLRRRARWTARAREQDYLPQHAGARHAAVRRAAAARSRSPISRRASGSTAACSAR